ncbi:MAG: zinc ribbon domain-containing protein [Thermoplasmata archaeon]
MTDFRLLVNECLREMLTTNLTSRGAISRYARTRALETRVTGTIGLAAADVARSLAKGHQRRFHQGIQCRVPYVRTPFVRVPVKSFHFDLETGRLRLSLRRGEWTSIVVPVSNYHRKVLTDPNRRVTQVHVGLHRVVFVYAQAAPEPYVPTSLVALDTNESSLDGVQVDPESASFVRLVYPEIRELQFRHMGRRQFLGRKKAHDRRLSRWLLGREGRRERNRIRSRLHTLTRRLIDELAARHSALALEDLTHLPQPRRRRMRGRTSGWRSRSLGRRLSSWPRAELHRQLAYKAQDRGVPILWVNPYLSSRTCPRCGEVSEHRRRVGTRFDCAKCGWSLDRQLNAGLNLGMTVLRTTAGLGGLRLDPDALPQDVVRPLSGSDERRPARVERMGREGERFRDSPSG